MYCCSCPSLCLPVECLIPVLLLLLLPSTVGWCHDGPTTYYYIFAPPVFPVAISSSCRSVCLLSLGMCYKRINMHFDLCPDWCHFLIPSIYMNVLLPTGTGSIVPDTVCAEFMPKAFCVSTKPPPPPFTTTATTIEKWWTKKYVCPGSSSIDNKFFFIEGFGLNCGGRQASRQTKTDNSLLLSHESPLL